MHSRISRTTQYDIQALIAPDLRAARDDADLAARLARNGYGFRDAPGRRVLVTLPHGLELMDLPHRVH